MSDRLGLGLASWRMVATATAAVAMWLLLAAGAVCSVANAASADLDLSFGVGGALTFPIVPGEDRIEAIAIQPDGKIVAAGTSFNGSNRDFAVARFNADGTPDTSFSVDGQRTLDVTGGGRHDAAFAVAVQPDGKIVVAGSSFAGLNEVFAIARFLPNGDVDSGFGGSGFVMRWFAISPSGYERAHAIALQTDDRIVVAGTSDAGGTRDFAVLRLLSNGAPDTSYAGDGTRNHPVGGGTDEIKDIALQPDGKIVAVGRSEGVVSGDDFAVARYNTDGSLDSSFSGGGVQTTALAVDDDIGEGVVVQPDGNIVVAGHVRAGGGRRDMALARYQPGGGLDPSFGMGGSVATSLAPYTTQAYDVALQNNGKIVVAGEFYLDSPAVQDFLVAQYTSAGALDPSFDGDGVFTRAFASPDGDFATAVAQQPDGKIVVGGNAWVGSDYDFALMRLTGELPAVNSTPTVTIDSPRSKKIRARKLKLFKGKAGPPGEVAKVEIALRRVDRKQLKRGRCFWLKNAKAKFAKSKAVNKRCAKPRFLPARGTESWSYRLKKRLAKGSYEFYVRVTLTNGATHTEFSKSLGNLRKFKVT